MIAKDGFNVNVHDGSSKLSSIYCTVDISSGYQTALAIASDTNAGIFLNSTKPRSQLFGSRYSNQTFSGFEGQEQVRWTLQLPTNITYDYGGVYICTTGQKQVTVTVNVLSKLKDCPED